MGDGATGVRGEQILGLTAAVLGLVGRAISGHDRQFAFRNGTFATVIILDIGLSQRIATAHDKFLTETGYVLLGACATVITLNMLGWLPPGGLFTRAGTLEPETERLIDEVLQGNLCQRSSDLQLDNELFV